MTIEFHRGDTTEPKGHAFIYMRSSIDHEEIWATYVVILPITVDISKYVPPFLMNQIGSVDPKDLSAFAFPPAPEQVPNYAAIEEMARIRNDDILYVGAHNPSDVAGAMTRIGEAVHAYSAEYARIAGATTASGEAVDDEAEEDAQTLAVNDVIYGLMSDSDKLGELSKLIGRLRFAVDGSDDRLIQETESEIALVASHLPESHSIPKLVQAVKSNDRRSTELANVYLQRSYHLVHEEYSELTAIENRIRDLEEGAATDG